MKGHQDMDNEENNASLLWMAQLNIIICDQTTTSIINHIKTLVYEPHLSASCISPTMNFQTITHHIPSQIFHLQSENEIKLSPKISQLEYIGRRYC